MDSKRFRVIYLVASVLVLASSSIYLISMDEPIGLGIVDQIAEGIIDFIGETNYAGILFLMTLESACIPIPSEVIMPFSGYLSYVGQLNFWLVVLAATIGNLIGSLAAYYIGLYGGRTFIEKYGRYVFLRKEDLIRAENWFRKYGGISVFISRMLPAVRTFISLPAGLGKMDLIKFSLYTFIGSIPWNTMLTYFGYELGKNWVLVKFLFSRLDPIFILSIILLTIYLLFLRKSPMETSR